MYRGFHFTSVGVASRVAVAVAFPDVDSEFGRFGLGERTETFVPAAVRQSRLNLTLLQLLLRTFLYTCTHKSPSKGSFGHRIHILLQ